MVYGCIWYYTKRRNVSVCVSDAVGPNPAKTLKHTEREFKIPKVQVGKTHSASMRALFV